MATFKEALTTSLTNFAKSIAKTYPKTANIVDNLLSTDSTLPLSAKQGNVLQTQIDELNSNLYKNNSILNSDSSRDISFDKGRYLLHFSQNGVWPRNGLAYLDLTGYADGSYFSWICGNLSNMLTVTINSTGVTITASSELGVGINIGSTKLKSL